MRVRAGENWHIVLDRLESFGGEVMPRATQSALIGAGKDIRLADTVRRYSRNAFKDKTGYLRASFGYRRPKRVVAHRRAAPGALLKSSAPHAHLVERGHGGPRPAPPHPFLEPVFRGTFGRLFRAMIVRAERHAQRISAQLSGNRLMTRQTVRWITGLRV